ncbi:MAG TPA: hypothetical protein VMF89_16075, partial [Polyangiales bacterium]|nr:hypothetical protein [Polyangiales bacterium]
IVDGARCEEVVDALALIAALAAREAEPTRDTRPPARARKPDKRAAPSTSESSPSPDEGETAARRAGSTTSESGPSGGMDAARSDGKRARVDPDATDVAANAERLQDEASTPRERADNSSDSSARTGPGTEPSSDQRNGAPSTQGIAAEGGDDGRDAAVEVGDDAPWRLGATAMLFSGLAPALQPGLQLQAAVALSAGAVSWSLQLGARIARSDAVASPDGDARFGFAGAVVRLCAAHALGSTPLTLTGCVAVEPGLFSAKGENTRNLRSYSRLWLAAGAAADLSVPLASWLTLRAGTELLAPFRRDRILLAGDTLYHIPALGFRWHLGLEVPFG